MTLPSDRMGQCIKARVWWEMLIVAKTLRRIAGRIDPAGYINYAQEGEDQLLLRLFEGRECGTQLCAGRGLKSTSGSWLNASISGPI